MGSVAKDFFMMAAMPTDLGRSYDLLARHRVDIHFVPGPATVGEFVAGMVILPPQTQQENVIRFEMSAYWRSWPDVVEEQDACDWLLSMALSNFGNVALADWVEFFLLEGAEDLAYNLTLLAHHDRPAFELLVQGLPGAAGRALSSTDYPADDGCDGLSALDAQLLVGKVGGYQACYQVIEIAIRLRERIDRPTGHQLLDLRTGRGPRRAHGAAATFGKGIEEWWNHERAYKYLQVDPAVSAAACYGRSRVSYTGIGMSRITAEDATASAVRDVRKLGFNGEEEMMEKLLRRSHGDDLELAVDHRMRESAAKLTRMGRHVRFRRAGHNQNVELTNALGQRTRQILLMAINYAVSLVCPPLAADDDRDVKNALESAVLDRIGGKQVSFDAAQDASLAKGRHVDGMIFPKAPKRYQLNVRHILFLLNNTIMKGDDWTTAEEDRLSYSDKAVHSYERLRDAHLKLKPSEPFESELVNETNRTQRKFYKFKPNRHVVAAVLEARGDIERRFSADAPFSTEAPD